MEQSDNQMFAVKNEDEFLNRIKSDSDRQNSIDVKQDKEMLDSPGDVANKQFRESKMQASELINQEMSLE